LHLRGDQSLGDLEGNLGCFDCSGVALGGGGVKEGGRGSGAATGVGGLVEALRGGDGRVDL